MKRVTIKPLSTLVAQFPAGVEVNAVQDEQGVVYVPVLNVPVASGSDVPEKKTVVEAGVKPTGSTKTYSEEEMMEMETKELEKICAKLGIDPEKTPGKNTNKKLRLLILDAQGSVEEEEEEENAPTVKEKSKKVVAKEEDEEDEEEEAPKKPSLKKAKEKNDEEEVEIEDLEKGDEVRVYWKTLKEWYDGVVKKVKGSEVVVYYEADDTDEVLDPKIHTQIIRKVGVGV